MSNKALNRNERKERTKSQLIQKATEMFAEQGYHNTSLNQIATSLGYTKGAIYSHFKSKQELFLAIFEQQQKDDIDTIAHFAQHYPSIHDFINALEAHHKIEKERNQVWSILRLEFLLQALREEEIRKELSKVINLTRIELITLLGHYATSGQLNQLEFNLKELVTLILSLDTGLSIQYYIDDGDVSDNIYAKGLKALINPI